MRDRDRPESFEPDTPEQQADRAEFATPSGRRGRRGILRAELRHPTPLGAATIVTELRVTTDRLRRPKGFAVAQWLSYPGEPERTPSDAYRRDNSMQLDAAGARFLARMAPLMLQAAGA
jgi:hypothetical protein